MSTNALEGIRVVLGLILMFLTFAGGINAKQGLMVIPLAVRHKILHRRRTQMWCTFVISIILTAQSMYVTQIPTEGEPSWGAYTANFSVILVLLVLMYKAFIHMFGWYNEGKVMRVPLSPEAEEIAKEAVIRGREIAHQSKNALSIIALSLERVTEDTRIPVEVREDAYLSLSNIHYVLSNIENLYAEIKTLKPDIGGPTYNAKE